MLWACIKLPHLAMDGILRRRPTDEPLVLVDGPGHGRSGPPPRGTGLADCADAAAQVLAMLREANATFEDRVMNERHFEFRGGLPGGHHIPRSRLADLGGG